MSKDKESLDSQTNGTTMNPNAKLDDDSRSLYSVGQTNFEPVEMFPFSSSSSSFQRPTSTTWEEVLKTIRL